jgi:hypothetical protein
LVKLCMSVAILSHISGNVLSILARHKLHWHKIRLLHTQITQKIKHESYNGIAICVCVKVDR